jgi:hypothetical protein
MPCSLASRVSVPHGEGWECIGTDVNADGLSLMSMKVREKAMAPRQMTTAIIAPTTSPQVARSSIRGSGVFMVLSFTRVWRRTRPADLNHPRSLRPHGRGGSYLGHSQAEPVTKAESPHSAYAGRDVADTIAKQAAYRHASANGTALLPSEWNWEVSSEAIWSSRNFRKSVDGCGASDVALDRPAKRRWISAFFAA